jgi:hypothetical protein
MGPFANSEPIYILAWAHPVRAYIQYKVIPWAHAINHISSIRLDMGPCNEIVNPVYKMVMGPCSKSEYLVYKSSMGPCNRSTYSVYNKTMGPCIRSVYSNT